MHILIVDDQKIQREIISYILRKKIQDIKISTASNGDEAINIVMQNPDIKYIIMDITMPICNGIEATKLIRMFNTKVKIYACTAAGVSSHIKEACKEAGVNGFLDKPFNETYINVLMC